MEMRLRSSGYVVSPFSTKSKEFVHQRVLSIDSFFSTILNSTLGDPQLEQSYSFFRGYFYNLTCQIHSGNNNLVSETLSVHMYMWH